MRIIPAEYKYWQLRFYCPDGREALHQVASYPQVSLVDAKKQRDLLLSDLLDGKITRTALERQEAKVLLTFDGCATRFVAAKLPE